MVIRFPNSNTRKKKLTRDELYEAVWESPTTKLAEQFGYSDVGLKKICKKYHIPTPPRGYWAKRAVGKHVVRPDLPSLPDEIAKKEIEASANSWASDGAGEQQSPGPKNNIFMPSIDPPEKFYASLHPVVALTARHLRKVSPDRNGLKHCKEEYAVNVTVSPATMSRALAILDYIAKSVGKKGYRIEPAPCGVRIVSDTAAFRWSLREATDKARYAPSKAELQNEAQRVAAYKKWKKMVPDSTRKPPAKPYRTWQRYPTGRLALDFQVTSVAELPENVSRFRNWHDRKTRCLEASLNKALLKLYDDTAAINLAVKANNRRQQERNKI